MVNAQFTCEGGLQMQLVDSRIEAALSHGNDNALLDGGALHRMCADVPPDGSEDVDRRRYFMCHSVIGEGLMFSSCHDEDLSVTACNNMIQSPQFGRSPREICTGGAEEEKQGVGAFAGGVSRQ